MIPEASLKSDSAFREEVTRLGIRKPLVTASLAVASVGVLILPMIKASGRLMLVNK